MTLHRSHEAGGVGLTLRGGLGNQLFQWSFGQDLGRRGYDVWYDLSCLEPSSFRLAGLIRGTRLTRTVYRRLMLTDKYGVRLVRGGIELRQEMMFQFDSVLNDSDMRGQLLHGYWQSPMYFANSETYVRSAVTKWAQKSLSEQGEDLLQEIMADRMTSIHVRRGDYMTGAAHAMHGLLPLQYFCEAREELRDQGSRRFLVFTDDPNWATEHLAGDDTVIVPRAVATHPAGEIILMAACADHILSNSSFSWWGAWLGKQTGHNVVPRHWFRDPRTSDVDLIPPTWNRSCWSPELCR